MNMENLANELSEMIIASTSSTVANAWMQPIQYVESARNAKLDGGNITFLENKLVTPMNEHTYISKVEKLFCSFESYSQNNVIETQGASAFPTLSSNVLNPKSNLIDARAVEDETLGQYKRRASAADVEQHQALLCASIDDRTPEALYACPYIVKRSGARRKFPRSKPIVSIDYDSVVIDLREIGLNTDNRETNDVLRLFGLFRKLNFYLNDVIPFEPEPDLTDYPNVFVKPKALMPCTMNVQSQIKHSLHQSNGFCSRLFEKLGEFKLADRDRYIQCSRSLFVLRKMIKQLEPFRTAEFEHKQGVFVNSFGAAQAKNLELLLEQLIGKIRECNIFVEMYLWSIKKQIHRAALPSMETLKKAVAIAGATLQKETSTLPLEKAERVETMDLLTSEESNELNTTQRNGGNGGGAFDLSTVPMRFLNQRPLRFIGI